MAVAAAVRCAVVGRSGRGEGLVALPQSMAGRNPPVAITTARDARISSGTPPSRRSALTPVTLAALDAEALGADPNRVRIAGAAKSAP